MPIEKYIIYIKLEKSPFAIEGNAKNNTSGDEIYNGTKIFVKVNAQLLVKAYSNKASFILGNKAIKIFFLCKTLICCPLYYAPISRNQSLNTISDESIIFFVHCLNPLVILERLGNSAGFRDSLNYGGEAIFRVEFEDDIFRARFHRMMV